MFRKPKSKKVQFAQSQEGFDAQASAFLVDNGFPQDADHLHMFATFVQHGSQDDDSFDPDLMVRRMRKALANSYAFYLIHPEKRPKIELATGTPIDSPAEAPTDEPTQDNQ